MKIKKIKPDKKNITAVIVAGGKGTRMGGRDKGLIKLSGKPIVEHIIERLSLQLDLIIVNANRNLDEYRQLGYPVINDSITGFQGPLAGILTALDSSNTEFIITIPCDAPHLADDFVSKMSNALTESNAEMAVANDGTRMQQMYALIPASLSADLTDFLQQGNRSVKDWFAQQSLIMVDFSTYPKMFININSREDAIHLEGTSDAL
ncbi:MAG: molybdenum cofactor guanylyltransferase MobA [Gammaproteobacteria bacterium]